MSFSIGGLASGLDTNQLVEQLMQIERRPIYLLQDQQKEVKSDLSAWESVAGNLSSLQNGLSNIGDTFAQMTTAVNNENIASVTADASATPATYNLDVTHLAQAHTLASDVQTDSTSELGLSGTFQINGVDIVVNTTDSLSSIGDLINETDGTGVTANIIDNQLVLKSSETGTANSININDETATVAQDLGLIDGTGAIKNELQAAKDAQFQLDGLAVTRSSNTISNVIEGVTVNLKQMGSTQFTIDKDIDAMVEKINSFIEDYNLTYGKLSSLTEKDGKLQGDTTLNQVKYKLRNNLTEPFDNGSSLNQLALLGIETDRYGNVSVNETELRNALQNNFTEVKELFTAEKDFDGFSGLEERLNDYISTTLKNGAVDGMQDMLQDRIGDMSDQIEDLEYRMTLKEKNLREKFVAMEKAISQMNNQQSWLQGQFSNMTSGLNGLM